MRAYFTKNYLFLILSVIFLVLGFLYGIIQAFSSPETVVNPDTLSLYSNEPVTVTVFNLSLMIETWISSLILASLFYAIHLHLGNQRKILLALNGGTYSSVDTTTVTAPKPLLDDNSEIMLKNIPSSPCSLCKKTGLNLKPARYTSGNNTQYLQVCEECFKNYNCEDLI